MQVQVENDAHSEGTVFPRLVPICVKAVAPHWGEEVELLHEAPDVVQTVTELGS